ncbi:MAG: TetR/AcrR family transcriptional regulator [Pseudomonadota bacterium]
MTRRYHHGDLRRALVASGLEILRESGVDALTLRACAARAGVSHSAPRNHFDGLTGLVAAIRAEGFRRHSAAMRAGMAAEPQARRHLGALRGYVGFARDNPDLYRLMFSRPMPGFSAELDAAADASFAVLIEISKGLDWPQADKVPGNANTWMMLWSFAHGIADLSINGQFGKIDAAIGFLPDLETVFPGFGYTQAPNPKA